MSRCRSWSSLAAGAALALLLWACAAPPPPRPAPPPARAEPRDELDPQLGLLVRVGAARFQIPKQWRLFPEGRHVWESPAEAPGMTLHVQQRPGRAVDQTWTDYWEQTSAQYHRRAGHIQTFLREEALTPPRADAGWLFVIQRREQSQSFILYQALLGHGQDLYIVTAAIPEARFAQIEPTLARVVQSLRPD